MDTIARVSGMIEDLESLHATCTDIDERLMFENKIEELKEILDFLRDLKLKERSRLKYLMVELVKLAQDVMDVGINDYRTTRKYASLQDEIKATKTRMISFGDGDEAEEIVVGLEEDVKKLLDNYILTNFKSFRMLSIKGMIGIGKTTLARQLYKAGASQFQRHAWLHISEFMSDKEILIKLVQKMVVGYVELNKRELAYEEMDTDRLQYMLGYHLYGLSYFIVLDNVWKYSDLKSILEALPSRGQTGSRLLLVTSCNRMKTYDFGYNYEMNVLDSNKGWKLFLKTVDKITSVENKFSKELERKGREMLKKCWGLPIAIIDVARQKAKQRLSGIEWEVLFDSIDLSETLKLLEPMYSSMNDDYQVRFLYMSFFKENAIMREEKLDQIWAANGLGLRNLTEGFAQISILKVVKKHFREIRCHLHPLLHMISIQKAEEEMGLEILRNNGNNRPSQNARHLVIHCGRDKFNHFTNEDSNQLISLIFHGGGGYVEGASSSYWESFEQLKILDMEDFGVKTLFEEIGALIELRYLGLRNNYIQEIPDSLAHLENLEVFDIARNFMVVVPDIIWRMGNLLALHMSNVIFQKPLKVDALQNLETLTSISIYDWSTYEVSSLKPLRKFRKLGIEEVDENSDVGTLFATLAKIANIEELFIRGFRYRSMPCLDEIGVLERLSVLKLDGRIGRLPCADCMPQLLMYVALVNTCLDEDPMPNFEKLRSLIYLKLQNAYTGREMVIRGFPRSIELCINELWNLRKIQVDDDAMWSFWKLEINNCPHLETLPEQISRMSELQVFKMVTTKYIATMIRSSVLTSEIFEVDIDP